MAYPFSYSLPVIAVYMGSDVIGFEEFDDCFITENEYAIRFFDGQVSTEPLSVNTKVKSLFSEGDAKTHRRFFSRRRKDDEEVPIGETRVLAVSKSIPKISIPMEFYDADGNITKVSTTISASISPADITKTMNMMNSFYLYKYIPIRLCGKYCLIVAKDLEDMFGKRFSEQLNQSHTVSKYTAQEISENRGKIETEIGLTLESDRSYWQTNYGLTLGVDAVSIGETEYDLSVREQKSRQEELRRELDRQQDEERMSELRQNSERMRVEEEGRIAMMKETQLLNSKKQEEENRHILEMQFLANSLKEENVRDEIKRIESARRRREFEEKMDQIDVENQQYLERRSREMEMEKAQAKRLAEIKEKMLAMEEQSRMSEEEHEKRLLEMEKARENARMGMLEKLGSLICEPLPETMLCPKCGSEIAPEAPFCGICGRSFQARLEAGQDFSADRERAYRIRNNLLYMIKCQRDPEGGHADEETGQDFYRIVADALLNGRYETMISIGYGANRKELVFGNILSVVKKLEGRLPRAYLVTDDGNIPANLNGWGCEGCLDSYPIYFLRYGDRLFFYADEGSSGYDIIDYISVDGRRDVRTNTFKEIPNATVVNIDGITFSIRKN